MRTDLPDLLTASSVLLAIITALYGLFYPAIKSILDIKPRKHSADNEYNYKKAKEVLKTKYLILLVGSTIITCIYLPEFFRQIKASIMVVASVGIKNSTYNTLIASFIVVCSFMIFISIMIVKSGIKLAKMIKNLNPNKNN